MLKEGPIPIEYVLTGFAYCVPDGIPGDFSIFEQGLIAANEVAPGLFSECFYPGGQKDSDGERILPAVRDELRRLVDEQKLVRRPDGNLKVTEHSVNRVAIHVGSRRDEIIKAAEAAMVIWSPKE